MFTCGAVTGVSLSAPASVAGFYGELLGWRLDGGVLSDADGVSVAALLAGTDGWSLTLDGAADRVVAEGGQLLGERLAADPAGVRFGLGAADVPLPPPGPGRPAWFEHMSTDPAAADGFYPAVFGWGLAPAGPSYAVFLAGERPVAGRLAQAPELAGAVGERWMVYLAHADVDAGAAAAQRLGGIVAVPPSDTPTGRLAAVVDPAGAVFTLLTPGSGAAPGQGESAGRERG